MSKFPFENIGHSSDVLERVVEAYGFTSKLALAEHFDMASSSLSMRFKRGVFPADMVVRCAAETGASLEWLATGHGKKLENDELDILTLGRKKLVDGLLYDSGSAVIDKVFFREGSALPSDPFCLLDDKVQYIIDRKYPQIYDGEWLVNVEGKISIRTLVRIPVNKVRVSGASTPFDCALEDIDVLGRVVMTITN